MPPRAQQPPNDARRAYYVAESGVRYALSRIRNANFHQDFIKEINNTPQYTLDDGSSFIINVFSPWFISPSAQNVSENNIFTLSVPNDGIISQNFSIPSGSKFRLVKLKTFKFDESSGDYLSLTYAEITGSSSSAGNDSLTITLEGSDGLQIGADDIACLAVQPTDADPTPLQAGDDIYIAAGAKNFFPSRNGAIRIVSNDSEKVGEYVYEELVDESTRVKLTNLAKLPGSSIFQEISDFGTDDWVVLSRYNYRVITTGTSGDVTTEIGHDKQVWLYPHMGDWTITRLSDFNPVVTNPSVAGIQLGASEEEDQIILGDSTPESQVEFGDIWYGGDKPIGGDSDFCQNGGCLFDKGVRVFFTLDYSGDGEGFVFALIAAGDDGTGNPVNTKTSAGGDVERSELLGYAGDRSS